MFTKTAHPQVKSSVYHYPHFLHHSRFPVFMDLCLKSSVYWCGSHIQYPLSYHSWPWHPWNTLISISRLKQCKELLIVYFEECWVNVQTHTNWFSWLRQWSWLVLPNCHCSYCTVDIDIAIGQHCSYYTVLLNVFSYKTVIMKHLSWNL